MLYSERVITSAELEEAAQFCFSTQEDENVKPLKIHYISFSSLSF
jgi:hypothetical protein